MAVNWFKTTLINLAVLILFVSDRILKLFFRQLSGGEFFVWGDWFKLKMTLNRGVAFGWPINYYLLIGLHILIVVFLVFLLVGFYRRRRYLMIFLTSLVLAGAISNLLDRIFFGGVIDYFEMKYFTVFNLADVMITLGAIGLIGENLRKKN